MQSLPAFWCHFHLHTSVFAAPGAADAADASHALALADPLCLALLTGHLLLVNTWGSPGDCPGPRAELYSAHTHPDLNHSAGTDHVCVPSWVPQGLLLRKRCRVINYGTRGKFAYRIHVSSYLTCCKLMTVKVLSCCIICYNSQSYLLAYLKLNSTMEQRLNTLFGQVLLVATHIWTFSWFSRTAYQDTLS